MSKVSEGSKSSLKLETFSYSIKGGEDAESSVPGQPHFLTILLYFCWKFHVLFYFCNSGAARLELKQKLAEQIQKDRERLRQQRRELERIDNEEDCEGEGHMQMNWCLSRDMLLLLL